MKQRKIKFVHTADIHMGMSFAASSFGYECGTKRRYEIKETFLKILEFCIEDDIELLFISGDLFDGDYIEISDLKDLKNKFISMKNCNIFISAGNHDAILGASTSYHRLEWPENVHIFSGEVDHISLEKEEIDIYGFSWDRKEIKEFSLDSFVIQNFTKTNILMIHGDIFNESNYLPLSIDELRRKGFDYIALGHIHKPFLGEGFAYPGSPEPLDFKETGEHGIILGEIEGKSISTEFLPFSKRSFQIYRMRLQPEMSFEEIRTSLIEDIRTSFEREDLVRIILEGFKDADIKIEKEILKESLKDKIFYCEIMDESEINYDTQKLKLENKDNLIGKFIEYVEGMDVEEIQKRAALYEGIKLLLEQ